VLGRANPTATVWWVEAEEVRTSTTEAQAAGERRIADRLDALEAERVLHRALELEAEAHSAEDDLSSGKISPEQLEKIAREIGVDPLFVQQALGEVRLVGPERSRLDRFILPDELIATATIDGMSRADVEAAVHRWMTSHEGLMVDEKLADGVAWDIDRRWTTLVVARSLSGGNRISRSAGSDVVHRIQSTSDSSHVVALESEGERPMFAAKGTLVLAAMIVLSGAIGSLGQDLVPFLQSVAGYLVIGGAVAAGGIAVARRWAGRIKQALRRSVNGLAAKARPAPQKKERRGWFSRRRKQDDDVGDQST